MATCNKNELIINEVLIKAQATIIVSTSRNTAIPAIYSNYFL